MDVPVDSSCRTMWLSEILLKDPHSRITNSARSAGWASRGMFERWRVRPTASGLASDRRETVITLREASILWGEGKEGQRGWVGGRMWVGRSGGVTSSMARRRGA